MPKQKSALGPALLASALAASAAQVTVLDRIGPDSRLSDGNPGGVSTHNPVTANPASTNAWGSCGVRWTQDFDGILSSANFVCFGRQTSPTNGNFSFAVTNFSGYTLNFHLWTNGVAGFTNHPKQGDIVVNLGQAPASPARFGSTTNSQGQVFPTYNFSADLNSNAIPVKAGQEYVMALVFAGEGTNGVVRNSLAATSGAPDVYGGGNVAAPGYTTNVGYSLPQYAASLKVASQEPEVSLTVERARNFNGINISWPDIPHQGLYSSADLSNWELVPASLATNKVAITNDGSVMQAFRLKVK